MSTEAQRKELLAAYELRDSGDSRDELTYQTMAEEMAPDLARELERLTAAFEAAPHAPDCWAVKERHVPGMTHYETDEGLCPAYHYRKGPCDCWKAALATGKVGE